MMKLQTLATPDVIGPHSQGYEANGFVFVSGQIGVNPADNKAPDGIIEQAEQSDKMLEQFWLPVD